MRLPGPLRRWRRRRRLRAAARETASLPLREFVYLDEVSVYSLYVSRFGAVAAEFTDTQSNSLRSEVGGTAEVGTGVIKAGVGSKLESTQTGASQIVRRAIIQSTFKELHDTEQNRLLLSPARIGNGPVPAIDNQEALEREEQWLKEAGLLVDSHQLERGVLLEVNAQVEPETIFKMTTMFSTLLDFIAQYPSLTGGLASDQLAEAEMAFSMFDSMLVGLVPLRCCCTDYMYLQMGDRKWLVHQRLIAKMSAEMQNAVEPLHIVGVAEKDLFWKDVRRVLFSGTAFTVLCRVSRTGIQGWWAPAKLVNVLDETFPDIGRTMSNIGQYGLAALRDGSTIDDAGKATQLQNALINYAERLAAVHGSTLNIETLEAEGLLGLDSCVEAKSVTQQVQLLQRVGQRVDEMLGVETSAVEAAEARAAALDANGLALGRDVEAQASTPNTPTTSTERLLDTEIVAIYW